MEISADRPISSIDDDTLGRANFAKEIAKGIVNLPAKDGFVIGLSGQWGSGKTSTLSMINEWIQHHEIERLNEQEEYLDIDQKVWESGDLKALARTYRQRFRYLDKNYEDDTLSPRKTARWHLLKQIKLGNDFEKSEYLAEEILRYFFLKHHVADQPSTIVFRFSPWLIPNRASLASAFIADLYLVIQRYLGPEVSEQARAYAVQLFSLIGTGADLLGDSKLKNFSDTLGGFTKERTKTLDELKLNLEVQLRKLGNRKLLIVIDDLDRMTPKEATQMIGLVKNLGDLPNIIYLISYDINIVGKHLETQLKLTPSEGQKYLHKIVQLQFELDQPQKHELFDLFTSTLMKQSKSFEQTPEKQFFDIIFSSLEDVWKASAAHFLETPRDITRLVNKFVFVWSALYEQTDPVDLLVLCIADVFDSELYRWIMNNQGRLNHGSFNIFEIDFGEIDIAEEDKNLSSLERIIRRSDPSIDIDLKRKKTLKFLFPNNLGERLTYLQVPEKNHHAIENRDSTSNYFRLAMPKANWPRTLLAKFEASKDYGASFRELLIYIDNAPDLAKSELRIRIIPEVEKWLKNQDNDFNAIIKAVLENAPVFIKAKDERGWTDNLERLQKIIVESVGNRIPKQDRKDFLDTLFDEKYDFTLPSMLVRRLCGTKSSLKDGSESIPFYLDPEPYLDKLVDRAEKLLAEKQLFVQAEPSSIIQIWWWSTESGFDERLFDQYLINFEYAGVFFDIDLNRSSSGDYINHKNPKIDHTKIKSLADRILSSTEAERLLKLQAQDYVEKYMRGFEKINLQ